MEVLVSLALCGVIAALAYRSLLVASDSVEISQKKLELIQQLDYTWTLLERDLQHAVTRVDDNSGSLSFEGQQPLAVSGEDRGQRILSFSRQGWQNPLQRQRSDLQRIQYNLQEHRLYRQYESLEKFAMPNQNTTHQQLLLTNVDTISLKFLPINSKSLALDTWQEYWPSEASKLDTQGAVSHGLPLAVQLEIRHRELGTAARLFYLPAAML